MELYKCGHPIKEVIINTTPESLSMYMEWKNSKSSLCIRCWNKGNKDIELNVLSNIEMFVNLQPHEKIVWVVDNPENTIDIIDYLVNVTKDR